MQIPTIPADKLAHYFWGSLAALVGLLAGWIGAALLCAAVAVGREAYNVRTGGKFDPRDVLATCLGGAAVLLAFAAGAA